MSAIPKVYDQDGEKVGYVDHADKAHGWMQVGLDELDLRKAWVPYRLVKSVDDREVFVSVTKHELHTGYTEPPARTTEVVHREGKAIAVTTEVNGYDAKPLTVSEVDVEHVGQLLAIDQRVWTSDSAEVGKINEFDAATGYVVIEKGILSRKRDLLIPVHLVADVDRDATAVTLAVREADLKRMQYLEAANVVIDLPPYTAY